MQWMNTSGFLEYIGSPSVSILIWKKLFKKSSHAPIGIALIDCIDWRRKGESANGRNTGDIKLLM